jgi:hypothetical protein
MCARITLTRPNLESIASELNIAPETTAAIGDDRCLSHRTFG